jgi:predicted metal-dependent hydrolase
MRSSRDRDVEGRARNARPRDALGRPLPHGAHGVPRVPEDLVLAPVPALLEAQRLLDQGLPFHAHEVLEGTWKSASVEERDLWQGLAQLAVGVTHLRRGNPKGAATLLQRGRSRISRYVAAPPYGIDISGLLAWVDAALAQLSGPSPDVAIDSPQLRRPLSGEVPG